MWRNGHNFLIRNNKWAFIQYDEDGGAGMELFNMEHDPKQYNNLAHNPEYQEVVNRMKKALENKLAEVRNNDL